MDFSIYEYELLNTYLNERADQGEALEYIGMVFGVYKKTMPGEYKYYVDYIENCDVNSEEFESYKKTWIDEKWEYVDFFEGMVIFRCKKWDSCIQPTMNSEEIKQATYFKVKKQWKSEWLQSALWILLAGVNIFIGNLKIAWIIIAAIQFLQFDSLLTYSDFKKRSTAEFGCYYNEFNMKKHIKKIHIIRIIKKILAGIFFILLLLVFIFYYKNTFFAKCAIVVSVVIIGSFVYKSVKMYNEKREKKFNFESAKGKFLIISIGMMVTIAVILSFVMIDQSKPKRDIIKAVPTLALECDGKTNYVNHDYGIWNYEYSNGISIGSEEEFPLPEYVDIESIDIGAERAIDISTLTKPDKMEIRYWKREDFNKLNSYDKGYKEIEIKNDSFTALEENVVYVVYAKWKKEFYDGVGYYVFTVEHK